MLPKNMRRNTIIRSLLVGGISLSLAGISAAETGEITERLDWKRFFVQHDAKGTIVVLDEREDAKVSMVFGIDRARQRYSPASTFKIPHALFALDAGVVRDEFQIIPWDGQRRSYEAWNRGQNLRSSMRHSVVWVYEEFARAIGEKRERDYMTKVQYGNADPTGDAPFWIQGNLRVSAHEQISFLRKLYRNELPFSKDAQRLVKDVMIAEAGRDWILRAKTGWSGTIGWWVGWVEQPSGAVFFALNIDTPNRTDDLPKREGIARKILTSLGALPLQGQEPKGAEGGADHPATAKVGFAQNSTVNGSAVFAAESQGVSVGVPPRPTPESPVE